VNRYLPLKFGVVITFPRADKTINARFYGGIGILYDWRERATRECALAALLRRINYKRRIRAQWLKLSIELPV